MLRGMLWSMLIVATTLPIAAQEATQDANQTEPDKSVVPMPVEEAVTAIGSDDEATRRRAAEALFASPEYSRRAVPIISDIIRDRGPDLPREPLAVLGVLGPGAKDAVPAIIAYLQRSAPDVNADRLPPRTQQHLLHVLVAIGPGAEDAVPVLISICDSKDLHSRYLACRALGNIGAAAKPAVGELIRRMDFQGDVAADRVNTASVRRNAAIALGKLGAEVAPEAVPALIKAMDDPMSQVRDEATLALGNFGEAAKPAVPHLHRQLESRNSPQRAIAASTLWKLNHDATEILPQMIEHLESGSLRYEAAQVMAAMGPAAAPAIPALVKTLDEQDEAILVTSIDALGSIGPAAAIALPALRGMLKSDEQSVRSAAENAIEKIQLGTADSAP